MKQVFAVFCIIILMPSMSAHAWVGGPWSNNNAAPGGDDGTYEAVATATNGMGMYRWGVKNSGGNLEFNAGSLSSSNLWYYRGISYFGQCFGTVNSVLGVVSVVGNGTNAFTKSTTTVDNSTNPPTVLNLTIGIFGSQGGNVFYCNSAFTAKFTSKVPVKRFKGSGTISFTGDMDTETTTTTLTYTSVPSGTTVVETTTSTGGESEDFPQRGKAVKFKVIGSQVSQGVAFD